MVVSHSYRIDHMTKKDTTSTHKILTLEIQSLKSPDKIFVYCDFKDDTHLPLALVPGSEVRFNSFCLRTAKTSGNFYCTNCAASSITITSMCGVVTRLNMLKHGRSGEDNVSLVPQMLDLPVSLLEEMMVSLTHGCLSRSVVCVQVSHVTVYRVYVGYRCRGCQCMLTKGRCAEYCLRRRPVLEVSTRYGGKEGGREGSGV